LVDLTYASARLRSYGLERSLELGVPGLEYHIQIEAAAVEAAWISRRKHQQRLDKFYTFVQASPTAR